MLTNATLTSALSFPLSSGVTNTVAVPEDPYDPFSWITGTPTKADDFETLALDAALSGRTLPTGGGTWAADAGWLGAGSGTCWPNTNGQAAKAAQTHSDCKVRLIWHPGDDGNNQVHVFCRDTQTTPFCRYGFLLSSYPAHTAPPPTQAIAVYRMDNYILTRLGTGVQGDGFYEASIIRGYNVMELRCVGTTITCFLNGEQLIELTDAAYTTNRTRWGFGHTNRSNDGVRVTYVDFTVL